MSSPAERGPISLAELDRLLIEGLESGEPIEVTEEFWEQLDRELLERHQRRGQSEPLA
ncbi:MAG: hypothetical protein U0836_11930 [Pirellulales bacterium]